MPGNAYTQLPSVLLIVMMVIYLGTYNNVSLFFLFGHYLLKLCPVPKLLGHPLPAGYGS
jgi:hypothetical protein